MKLPTRVFFGRGTGGTPGGKNFARPPPTDHCSSFLTKACPIQLSFVPKNFKNFTSFFSQFWLRYFLAQNCIRKVYFMHKTPKFANFWCRGTFLASANNFSKFPPPPHLTPSPMWVPPSDSVPDGDRKPSPNASPPTDNFVKNPEHSIHRSILCTSFILSCQKSIELGKH